jgi:hypothetical protein
MRYIVKVFPFFGTRSFARLNILWSSRCRRDGSALRILNGKRFRPTRKPRILGKLLPTQSDALLKGARQIADGRVVAGVHYTSDTEAGLALGDLLFAQLETKTEFQKDLTAAATKDQLPLK